jgi:peptidoglycan/LPS O-acetylase OafA/YrhL
VQRIKGLDGIRCFAVLFVVAAHTHVSWMHGGGLGVDVFFVLSGYLITTLLLREHERTGRIDVPRFWGRRVLRLLPALVLLVLVIDTVALFAPGRLGGLAPVTLSSTPGVLFYFSNWLIVATNSGALGAFGPLWSLSVEEQFYLLWPLLVILALRFRKPLRTLTILIGVLVLAVIVCRFAFFDPGNQYQTFATSFRVDMLLMGALLGVGFHAGLTERIRRLSRWAVAPAILYLVAASVLVPEFNIAGVEKKVYLYYTIGLPAVGIATVSLIAFVVTHQGSLVTRFLSLQPFDYLGRISYGIYLWHYPVILLLQVRFHPDPNITLLLSLPITVALATASWFALERPLARRFHHRLLPRPRVAAPAAVAAD